MTAEDLARAVFLLPPAEKLKVIQEALAAAQQEARAAALREAAKWFEADPTAYATWKNTEVAKALRALLEGK